MINLDLEKIFSIRAETLNKQIELIADQPGELRGRAREVLMSDFLEPLLPDKMGIEGGVVFSTTGASSGEMDIIVYDKESYALFKPFAYYMPKRAKPFPAEVVYATIEVENRLTQTRLEEIARKIQKTKSFPKTAFHPQQAVIRSFNLYGKQFEFFPTIGGIFTYESEEPQLLIEKLASLNTEIDADQQIDFICILNRGVIAYNNQKDCVFLPKATATRDLELRFSSGTPANNLKWFYLALMHLLSQAWVLPINVLKYFQGR